MGKLAKHADSRMHMLSVERRHNFTSATPIVVQLNDAAHKIRARKEEERIEHRHVVETIFDIVRNLAKQNNAFRGHGESTSLKVSCTPEEMDGYSSSEHFIFLPHEPE